MDGGPNCRDKAAFSDFSGVVWTGLEMSAAGLTAPQNQLEVGR